MIPDPTPLVGTWNGPRLATPSAVIVTTVGFAAATIATRSTVSTVLDRVDAGSPFAVVLGLVVASGSTFVATTYVPVEASVAERTLTAISRVAPPQPRHAGRGWDGVGAWSADPGGGGSPSASAALSVEVGQPASCSLVSMGSFQAHPVRAS